MSGILSVIALQAQPRSGGFLDLMVLLVPLFLIFYLFLIRPQQKRQREHDDMLKALAKGDTAVTSGGIHGKVVGVSDESLTLEIPTVRGDKVRLKVDRARIERRIEAGKKEKAS
jgi:preprotein translocase subunit YajC